jgi:hypothetical protein
VNLKKIYPVFLISAGMAIGLLLAFKPQVQNKSYHHLFFIAEHADLDDIRISMDGKEYSVVHADKQRKEIYDMNPLINLIHQYEADGWEMQSYQNAGMQTVWMRKEK